MGSLINIADTNIVIMGVMVATMVASIGVVMVIAFKNEICVRNKPSIEAMKMAPKSRKGTFSFGVNIDKSQNSTAAPMERMQKRAMGDKRAKLAMSLHTMVLRPKITYAKNAAKCPNIRSFDFIIAYRFCAAMLIKLSARSHS